MRPVVPETLRYRRDSRRFKLWKWKARCLGGSHVLSILPAWKSTHSGDPLVNRSLLFAAFSLAALCGSLTCAEDNEQSTPATGRGGFISLFNGKDLTGWKGDETLWSVEDGCITGKTNGPDHLKYNRFLIWDGQVADFVFECEFRLEGNNNSGVQYRSRHDRKRGDWVVVGYQADIHGNPQYTGMLYDEKGRGIIAKRGQRVVIRSDGKKEVSKLDAKLFPPDERIEKLDLTKWHKLSILAIGNRALHILDDRLVADITDEQESERELEGVLALQVHRGAAMKAQFRKLKLTHLKGPRSIEDFIKDFTTLRSGVHQYEQSGKSTGTVFDLYRGGKRLKPRTKPGDTSKLYTKSLKPSAKSSPRPEEATPKWIWLNEGDEPAQDVYFRREFSSAGVGAARLYAACDDVMKIFVDGKLVGESGTWEKPLFVDLSKHLDLESEQKNHVLAVEAHNGKSAAGLLVKIDFESGWRDAWSVVSDASWQASKQKPADGWKKIEFKSKDGWQKPQVIAALGAGPWAKAINAVTLAAAAPLREPEATSPEDMKVAKGFRVELLYSVPKGEQGSWVNMCHDPKGRLIVSDQYGSLYRVTPPVTGQTGEVKVEKINVDIGEAQGLLWAFDSLYVNVNKGKKYDGGLYRVTDEDGDGDLDTVKMLRPLKGTGEHGPHAVLPHPDGKSLVVICGNRTELTKIDQYRAPKNWDEDNLLPRVQGRFMRGTRAPGGYICRIDPEGRNWELIATGFRNQFDGAFNADGELFTYDADMEWDFNLPWYRPTRICHVISGAEFGWRSGGGKFPVYYEDSLPPVVNVGPGSPTGVCFGYGAKFPAKYQRALFACDWSYGKLYATHLTPDGSTYSGKLEEFITGTPLPLTDVIVNPHDGAMYFTIGGRRVQSGLYRVTYTGKESTGPADLHDGDGRELRGMRKRLEAIHLTEGEEDFDPKPVLEQLGSDDRFVRFAARVALENHPASWDLGDINEKNPNAVLNGLMAFARGFQRTEPGREPDIDTPAPDWGAARKIESEDRRKARRAVFKALEHVSWSDLSHSQKLTAVRVLTLTFLRIGPPDRTEELEPLRQLVNSAFPAKSRELNSEIAQLMVYLQHPEAAGKIVQLLVDAPTQEEQIDFARTLRHLRTGWTPELRKAYFEWFVRAQSYRGGASFQIFVNNIKAEAMRNLSDEEKVALKPTLEAKPDAAPTFTRKPRPLVKKYTMQDLVPLVQNGLKNRDFDAGRKLFGEAACFACHRFDNQGGAVGPDLTALSGRFSARDILESIVEPSKQISDQYGSVNIITLDGKAIHGRIINLAGDSFRVQTDMLNPGALQSVDRKQIDEIIPSKISMMPEGLLNVLTEEEILDLMAYLLSRGDRTNAMFQQE